MRVLLIAVLALAITSLTADAMFTVIGYDEEILDRQARHCPPRGPYAHGGCDQCLAVNHDPLLPFFQIFCGPDRPCRLPGDTCPACNGTCIGIWSAGYSKWFVAWGDAEPVRDVITACNEWLHQSYCPSVSGAYFIGESFSWLPPHQRSYRDLSFDPLYRQVLDDYTGPIPFGLDDAWLHRIGLFAEMARLAPPAERAHYARAANLSAWYYVAAFAPADQRDEAMAAAGFPAGISSQEHRDLTDIHGATCSAPPFYDCTDPVDPSTWGAIKRRFRAP